MKEQGEVKNVDIESLDELILKDEAVLSEMTELVIPAPEPEEGEEKAEDTSVLKWTIVKVGENVKKYKEGDRIHDVSSPHSLSYFDAMEKHYVLTDMYNIKLATKG